MPGPHEISAIHQRLWRAHGRHRGDDAILPAASALERLAADSVQFDWDLERQEVSIFVRTRDGGVAGEPALVCTLDQWLQCISQGDRLALRAKLLTIAGSSARSFDIQFRVDRPDGHPQWADLCGVIVRDKQGRPRRVIGQQGGLASSGEGHSKLVPSAFHDPLTGLPNRRLFERCLSSAIETARQDGRQRFAVLFVDLDGFKAVNDRHGHLMGDRTLVAVAQRMAHIVRPDDVLARRDGDEFTILVRDVWHQDDAALVADRILQQLHWPLSLDGTQLTVTASIGIGLSWAELLTPDDLLQAADKAMYDAKSRGGNRYALANCQTPNGANLPGVPRG